MRALRYLKFVGLAIVTLVLVATFGYHYIEGWPLFDGFYMAITTITTIGYTELHPLSQTGRIFNSFVIVFGVSMVFLTIGLFTEALVEFEFDRLFGRRKMEREISRLEGHYIICGAGRVGRNAARELARKPVPFLIIESSEPKMERYRSDYLMMSGDATREDVLHQARIEHAAGLVAATTTDASNTYIVLTARSMNPKLKIIARASEEEAEKHLRAAGADIVVSPYTFAGHRIAHSFLRPNVVDFVDVAMAQQNELGLEIEEVEVTLESSIANKSVRESKIRADMGIIVLAIKRKGEKMRYNPSSEDMILAGDSLIVMGEPAKLRQLEGMAAAK
jgi:voltage-gated potassium channel